MVKFYKLSFKINKFKKVFKKKKSKNLLQNNKGL